jgi:hypothetical protein
MRKFKCFADHKVRASQFLQKLARDHARLFVQWLLGMTARLPDGSRMSREVRV